MGYYYFDRRALEAAEPFPAAPVATEPAQVAYEHVLKDAGATLPKRDSVDERIIHETREGTGHIINWIKEVGGGPIFHQPQYPFKRNSGTSASPKSVIERSPT